MKTMRMAVLLLAVAATALTACGRKNAPVPPSHSGEEGRPLVLEPGERGLARGPGIVRSGTDTTVPGEVARNPNAEQRPFILDGLLN